ncbi:MAG: non-canonical purine NTP pyrophosphatase [Oscillospiraceae bacterium]
MQATTHHKLEEFRAIFADMGIEIIPQSAAGCHFEVDETGETFEENAYLKAIAVTRATGQPAVADDSGLMVDALGGAPGVHWPAIPAGTRIRRRAPHALAP